MQTVRTRAYREPSKLSQRIGGVVPTWLALLAIAVIVAGAVVSPSLTSGPQTVTGLALSFGANSLDGSTDGDIESMLALGVQDGWLVNGATTGGFSGATYLRMSIGSGGTTLTCAQVFGKVTVREALVSSYVTLSPKEVNGVACISSSTAPAFYFDNTLTHTVYPATWSWQHVWNDFPPGDVTYSVVALT